MACGDGAGAVGIDGAGVRGIRRHVRTGGHGRHGYRACRAATSAAAALGASGRPRAPWSCATKVRRGHRQSRAARPRHRRILTQSRPATGVAARRRAPVLDEGDAGAPVLLRCRECWRLEVGAGSDAVGGIICEPEGTGGGGGTRTSQGSSPLFICAREMRSNGTRAESIGAVTTTGPLVAAWCLPAWWW